MNALERAGGAESALYCIGNVLEGLLGEEADVSFCPACSRNSAPGTQAQAQAPAPSPAAAELSRADLLRPPNTSRQAVERTAEC